MDKFKKEEREMTGIKNPPAGGGGTFISMG
jgi:hypothetical protein